MVFDLSYTGEAHVTMRGYVDEMLALCGVTRGARAPATDRLSDVKDGVKLLCDHESEKCSHEATPGIAIYRRKRHLMREEIFF